MRTRAENFLGGLDEMPPRKKQGSDLKPVFIGDFAGRVFGGRRCSQHKKAGHGFLEKFHAARAANQDVEPEAGRMIQMQMSNLVNGVVTRSLTATDATNDRVGTCGTKLLNGFSKTPLAGRSTASLPVRCQSIKARPPRQARKFLPRKGPPASGSSAPEKLDV